MILFKELLLGCFISYFLVEIFYFVKQNIHFKFKNIEIYNDIVTINYCMITCSIKFRLIIFTKCYNNNFIVYSLFSLIKLK